MAIGGHCLVCSRDESLHISKRGAQCNESAIGLCSMKTCYIVTQQIFNRKIYPFRLPVKYFFLICLQFLVIVSIQVNFLREL